MSATSRHAVSPSGRDEVGTQQMEGQQGSNTQADATSHLRNPFTGRSASTDSAMESGSPFEGDSRRADSLQTPASPTQDRRLSKEWDAAKVPPSRFQKREGSIFSTSSSRDSHITRKDRDASYHAKLKEKGWV
ncbi:hypothetical protein LOZ53_001242 [Ophidiomyces ophidiicola]|uniref:Uncharacterized protein n=1 Tax=Ophidiomyces ophidiicola TaxID=1387563 RepID=A0ACB8UUB3_9EURO|nr:uncharacterized protein LOZ57_004425 [Ophidiomyces ophidiicola]KAI1915097.1 hypothetical protein LOZ64_003665 [Ophidiomyces ophidiicola]KAI1917782.1 hypothetical protein LOZ61_000402 [Ophidiomyces ophidiicola]KAI1922720.1 hypothetical protein LOZ60_005583 [Ophidiomyces ophidiicola]KAI1945127.1 hypothetical protein LOZ57_004425 [Ophidiomyces ophidiicola]KAI1946884.1 hypothetical protein LOZ62_003178 [Ophidiomyces ophidiicola]